MSYMYKDMDLGRGREGGKRESERILEVMSFV